jgi:hypothetical protein
MAMLLVRSVHAKPEAKEAKPSMLETAAESGRVKGQRVELERQQLDEAVASPGDPIQGWGQLGAQEGAKPELNGIGLSQGGR